MAFLSQVPCLPRAIPGLRLGVHSTRSACLSRVLGAYRCRFVFKRTNVHSMSRKSLSMQRAHRVAATASAETGQVKFKCTASVEFGETMKVVGDSDALGNWEIENGVDMEWGPGDVWTAVVYLPQGTYELKCVKVKGDGSADWEPGENRVVEVQEIPNDEELLLVDCQYFDVESTAAAVKSVDEEEEDSIAEKSAAEDEATKSSREGVESTESKHEASGSVEAELEEPTVTGDSESQKKKETDPVVTSQADETDGKEDGTSSTPQAVAAGYSNGEEGDKIMQAEKINAEPDTISDSEAKQTQSKAPDTSSTELSKGVTELSPVATKTEVSTASIGSTASSAGNDVSDKGATNPIVSIIGLLSVPVVVWSEYTLKTTGCGLEPGPGGLLGALEGISYLVVAGSAAWFLYIRFSGKSQSGGLAKAAEVSLYSTILGGLVVLGLQVQEFGYIPSALPDDKCTAQPTPLELPSFSFGGSEEKPSPALDISSRVESTISAVSPAPKSVSGSVMGKTTYQVTAPSISDTQ